MMEDLEVIFQVLSLSVNHFKVYFPISDLLVLCKICIVLAERRELS